MRLSLLTHCVMKSNMIIYYFTWEYILFWQSSTSNRQSMDYKIKTIPLSVIDMTDNTYQISTNQHIDLLADNITRVGLINPPILRKKGAIFSILSGFRRVVACRKLCWNNIEARIVENDEDDLSCVTVAIADNAHQRPLNSIEISRSIHMLDRFFMNIQDLTQYASTLGLPNNSSLLEKLHRLYFLPKPVQQAILSDTISLAMALELDRFDTADSTAFTALFEKLKLSLNKQREIVTLVREIALRESISVKQLLTSKDMQDILNDRDLDRTQKTQHIRTYLRQRRFPTLSQMERTFEKYVKELGMGEGLLLIPPQNFEGNTYRIQLHFTDIDGLRSQRIELDRIMNDPKFKVILKR